MVVVLPMPTSPSSAHRCRAAADLSVAHSSSRCTAGTVLPSRCGPGPVNASEASEVSPARGGTGSTSRTRRSASHRASASESGSGGVSGVTVSRSRSSIRPSTYPMNRRRAVRLGS
jgi:hypothetical protein